MFVHPSMCLSILAVSKSFTIPSVYAASLDFPTVIIKRVISCLAKGTNNARHSSFLMCVS
jgi:hypothetical protein